MGVQRIIIILLGSIGMFLLMLMRRKSFPNIKIWKIAIVNICLTIAGVIGAVLMHYIESGNLNGTSFFGAVLFVPIIMIPVVVIKVPYGEIMDLCAPAEALMLAFMKMDCLLVGCCMGKYLPNIEIQFPSQIIEMIVAIIITIVLVKIEKNTNNKNMIYGWYLVIYGAIRFLLNWFRYGVKPFVWILPAGNFWSIVAIIIGSIWIFTVKQLKIKKVKGLK